MKPHPSKEESQHLHMQEIRKLARDLDSAALDQCLDQQVREGHNRCENQGTADEIANILAKADFVRHRMDQGMSLRDAVRELGQRIRALQRG